MPFRSVRFTLALLLPALAAVAPADAQAPTTSRPLADRALLVAREAAREGAVGLDVLHVTEPMQVHSPYGVLVAPPLEYDAMAGRAREALRAREEQAAPAIASRVFVTLGDPVDEVIAHARREGVGLIVMGSHGFKGFESVLLGSVAEGVVRRARCPVLVVKAAGEGEAALAPAQEAESTAAQP